MSDVHNKQVEGNMSTKTISVNGTVYDNETGAPLHRERVSQLPDEHSARQLHRRVQKSTTLNRRYVRPHARITTEAAAHQPMIHHHTKKQAPTVAQSARVTHFSDVKSIKKQPITSAHQPIHPDIQPTKHRLVEKAQQKTPVKQQTIKIAKTNAQLKHDAIAEAMAKTTPKASKKEVKQARKHSKTGRFFAVASASMAILFLGACVTYLNMPALSTRVAASQAGIHARYPAYEPSGFSLNGPVAYQQGSVIMKFAAHASPQNYTLAQTRTDWDSTAVLDSYVIPKAGNNYETTTAGGITIHTYKDTAVWVNNNILYTLTGNANLSSSQIQRIATSL